MTASGPFAVWQLSANDEDKRTSIGRPRVAAIALLPARLVAQGQSKDRNIDTRDDRSCDEFDLIRPEPAAPDQTMTSEISEASGTPGK